MQPVLRTIAFVPLMLIACPSLSVAEETTEESFIPNFVVASTYYLWGGETDFSDASGSFAQQEAGIGADLPVYLGDHLKITAGFGYRWNQLEFSDAAFPLGSQTFELHRLDFPINGWLDLSDRWKMWLRLQPGFNSDFEHVDAEDFTLTSLAVFSYRWTDWLRVAFGAFYSRETGEQRILPALGFLIEPDPHWSLALTFPRVEIAYAPTPDWLLSARAVLGGGGWNISDPAGGSEDVDLNYQAIRLGLGVDRRFYKNWWAYVDAGMQVAQEIELEGAGSEYSADLDPSAYVASGIRLRF